MSSEFEYDRDKNAPNLKKKQGICFGEAAEIF